MYFVDNVAKCEGKEEIRNKMRIKGMVSKTRNRKRRKGRENKVSGYANFARQSHAAFAFSYIVFWQAKQFAEKRKKVEKKVANSDSRPLIFFFLVSSILAKRFGVAGFFSYARTFCGTLQISRNVIDIYLPSSF